MDRLEGGVWGYTPTLDYSNLPLKVIDGVIATMFRKTLTLLRTDGTTSNSIFRWTEIVMPVGHVTDNQMTKAIEESRLLTVEDLEANLTWRA